jgi:hypothetical protein
MSLSETAWHLPRRVSREKSITSGHGGASTSGNSPIGTHNRDSSPFRTVGL